VYLNRLEELKDFVVCEVGLELESENVPLAYYGCPRIGEEAAKQSPVDGRYRVSSK
jgi:hypothetical protein